jgi:hypothetical protein
MAFKFKDLIVTLVPPARRGLGEDSGGCDVTSGGCGGTCDAGSQSTVGSCTSECGGLVLQCGQSDEVLNPIQGLIDPAYMVDLRLMLRLAIAKTQTNRVATLEAHMQPHTLEEVDLVEKRLADAQTELRAIRQRLQQGKT